MVMHTVGKLVGRITDSRTPTEEAVTETDGGVNVQLYECSNCDVTYIGTSMDACSECNHPLESIRTERELGIVGNKYR